MEAIHPGLVVWITGLPGSGKTSVASKLARILRSRRLPVVQLDGDEFRKVMGDDLGYDSESRLRNARRISRLCKLIADQGVHVIAGTVSLFRERHEWNRKEIPRYFEVYLEVSLETIHARNQKGLYSGDASEVVGMDQSFDVPERPDLRIRNDNGGPTPDAIAEQIAEALPLP